jgi:hypothetical protein
MKMAASSPCTYAKKNMRKKITQKIEFSSMTRFLSEWRHIVLIKLEEKKHSEPIAIAQTVGLGPLKSAQHLLSCLL